MGGDIEGALFSRRRRPPGDLALESFNRDGTGPSRCDKLTLPGRGRTHIGDPYPDFSFRGGVRHRSTDDNDATAQVLDRRAWVSPPEPCRGLCNGWLDKAKGSGALDS